GVVGSVVPESGAASAGISGTGGVAGAFAGVTARSASISGIAGTAAALDARTARISTMAAVNGVLGADTAGTIRAAEVAALAGLRATIAGANGAATALLLIVEVGDIALFQCAANDEALYHC